MPGRALSSLVVRDAVILTVDSERRIIDRGAVAIEDGRITDVAASEDVVARHPGADILDAHGGVVHPGLVDAHVHVGLHLHRSTIPDMLGHEREHEQYVPYSTAATEEDRYASALLACMEMVRAGTTTFAELGIKYDVGAAAANHVGIRGVISERNWDQPGIEGMESPSIDRVLERMEILLAAHPQSPARLTWAGAGTAGMGRTSDRLLQEIKALADRFRVRMYMHQSFSPADTEEFRARDPAASACEHLEALGVLDQNLQLIHMIQTDEREVRLMAKAGAHVIHCPAASLRVGMGVSQRGCVPEMLAAGVNVGLGSDAGNYSDALDVGRQAYLAATIHRDARQAVPTITAEQAIEMATINGARALGVDHLVGSIEVGKLGDLVVHSPSDPRWIPGLDPVTSLVYSAGTSTVDTVIVGGSMVLRAGAFTDLDEFAEYEHIRRAAKALYARMDYRIPTRWPVVD